LLRVEHYISGLLNENGIQEPDKCGGRREKEVTNGGLRNALRRKPKF
jgi:hypothetical protein